MIVNRIKELREERMQSSVESDKWTQEGMARRLGVSRQTVISMEKGTYNPSLILAFKLARAFNMAIEDIFEYRVDDNET
jgi:putative transcriptional regulator